MNELNETADSTPNERDRFNLPREEERILSFWLEQKIFERSVEARRDAAPFVFFEGPPTANGKPGIHHVIARAFKDVLPRYQTMRGRRVERRAGWDTHGLPVELQVEKELGISGKPQIENIVPGDKRASIAKFNELCRQSVWKYKGEFERFTSRMGFWIDMDQPYITYDPDYIESLWWILKSLWQKELLYQDFKVVPYCPRCGTSLSSHEVAQGYSEVTDQAVYVKFPVRGQSKTYLVAWTTTPWTLPGNVALAVSPSLKYGRYQNKKTGETYILADARKPEVLGEEDYVRSDITVDELTALTYEPLFQVEPLQSEQSYRVYEAEFVNADDGSGIVHTAVMYGEDDFALGTKVGLPKVHTVGEDGRFAEIVPELSGQFVKDLDTEKAIIHSLEERDLLHSQDGYTHTYPFCWRCKTPLLYYARSSWFIRMSELRTQLLEANGQIEWVPEHLRDGRFGEWLRDVKDWSLSRERYWGTPLPIWRCGNCTHRLCIGSREELAELAGSVPDDLHRPYIDDCVFPCTQCATGTMERYPEVIDVWFDSGAMPFAQWHYPFTEVSKQKIDGGEGYPADYIAEAIDQTRGWFYTLLAVATALGRPVPYRRVISMAHVLDKHGKKMSKSLGNVVDPMEVMASHGADPIRFYFYSVNQPSDPKRFNLDDVMTVTRKVFLILWNTYKFYEGRMNEERWAPSPTSVPDTHHILDGWLVERTNAVTRAVTASLDALDFFTATRELESYIQELSTWYLRLSRKRTDSGFLSTFHWALRQVALLLAPFAPFFAELLWQRVRTEGDVESVHLADWPATQSVDEVVLNGMNQVRSLVELGRAARAEAGIKLRQPLRRATVQGAHITQGHEALLKDELNVKDVVQAGGDTVGIVLDTTLDDELRAEGLARDIVRAVQGLRKDAGLQPSQSAQVAIAGGHELLSHLTAHEAEMSEQLRAVIVWRTGESRFNAEVSGLTLWLEV